MMKIPAKIGIFITVAERIGIPAILCLAFAYIYFTQLQKIITTIDRLQADVLMSIADTRNSLNEIRSEIRRSSYRRGRDG